MDERRGPEEEAVARAICKEQIARGYLDLYSLRYGGVREAEITVDRAWSQFLPDARAAIAAMRGIGDGR